MNRTAPVYPVALRLDGARCLVVGAGPVAARKARKLIDCGAEVVVVAPLTSPEMDELPVKRERRLYEPGDAAGDWRLVVAATGDAEVDRLVSADAGQAGVLVNAVDDPSACSFFAPAVLRRGPVTLAVSTDGSSPFLAGWIRSMLAEKLGDDITVLAEIIGEVRAAAHSSGLRPQHGDWVRLVEDEVLPLLSSGDEAGARRKAERWLADLLALGEREAVASPPRLSPP
jgi:siroheme synthase-like protein